MKHKIPELLNKFYEKYPEGIYFGEEKKIKIGEEFFFFSDIAGNKGDNAIMNSVKYMNYYFEKDENFEEYNPYELEYEDLHYIGLTIGGSQIFICTNPKSKYYNNMFYEDYENEVFKKIYDSLEEFYIDLEIEL